MDSFIAGKLDIIVNGEDEECSWSMTPVVQYFKCTKSAQKFLRLKSGKDFILIISSNYWKFWLTTSKEIEKLKEIGRKSFQNWYIKIIWFFIVKYFGEYWKNFFLASHDHQRIQSFCHNFEKVL